jgi:hypothetical protein
MAAELPRCAVCRVTVDVGATVTFRRDGRVQHVNCPPVMCPVCSTEISPNTPIRRDGNALLHGNCWVRRARLTEPAADGSAGIVMLIRGKLASGVLPRTKPVRVWGSMSARRSPCAACGERIVDEAEYELEFADSVNHVLHRVCYGIWDRERAKSPPIEGGSAPSPWTLFFDLAVARRAADDRRAFAEMLAASSEAVAVAAAGRTARARTVERSRGLVRRALRARAVSSALRVRRA